MINSMVIPPALIIILGGLLIPLFRGHARSVWVLLIPVIGFINLLGIETGDHAQLNFIGYQLTMVHVDRLALAFGYIFHIAIFITGLYALYTKKSFELVSGFFYAGCAVGAVFAGDLITLFVFWEMMTIGSVGLIWVAGTKAAKRAGLRYALVHITGGVMLLFGIIIYISQSGSVSFGHIGLGGIGTYLIFIGFGVNSAWPLLHNWLPDAYPESTVAGTVFLSAFTTKTAVYVLARSFAGTEALIWIGAAMTCLPIFFAVIENNLRRVLSYSLINQVGFMLVGIGIGTELALNGTVAHAFAHILYKALLFMSMGAVLYRTGKIHATDLGGLYRTMPWTAAFCIIGAMSISAFPLFSGFVSKSMVMSAAGHGGYVFAWFAMVFASVGVLEHAGIKVPFFAFFSHDSGLRPKEAPWNMLLAMGIAAALCVGIGTFPKYLYGILPYTVDYIPYTVPHVMGQLQLLFFSALAFMLLMLGGIYPAEMRSTNLDSDWFYRKGWNVFIWALNNPVLAMQRGIQSLVFDRIPGKVQWFFKNPLVASTIIAQSMQAFFMSPKKQFELRTRIAEEKRLYPGDSFRHWPVGSTVLWVTFFLIAYLLVYYLSS
ncbi:Na(+)/H(+) antiporter subunit D [Nitrospirota bacterium]